MSAKKQKIFFKFITELESVIVIFKTYRNATISSVYSWKAMQMDKKEWDRLMLLYALMFQVLWTVL